MYFFLIPLDHEKYRVFNPIPLNHVQQRWMLPWRHRGVLWLPRRDVDNPQTLGYLTVADETCVAELSCARNVALLRGNHVTVAVVSSMDPPKEGAAICNGVIRHFVATLAEILPSASSDAIHAAVARSMSDAVSAVAEDAWHGLLSDRLLRLPGHASTIAAAVSKLLAEAVAAVPGACPVGTAVALCHAVGNHISPGSVRLPRCGKKLLHYAQQMKKAQ